eukprot:9446164-Pyramimonas_sp.AAC.1
MMGAAAIWADGSARHASIFLGAGRKDGSADGWLAIKCLNQTATEGDVSGLLGPLAASWGPLGH